MASAFVASFAPAPSTPRRGACVSARRPAWTASAESDERALPAAQGPARPKGPDANSFGFVGADRIGVSFTCTANECGTRISKMIRRSSYEKGTVLIQCPNCSVKHIISDHLGWYSDVSQNLTNIEKIAESKGESVLRVDSNVFGLESLISK